ncbi:MAG: glycosyltransferase [Blastochloris sp.]|nr:glycosyltransferase [Blastochloris sp.]
MTNPPVFAAMTVALYCRLTSSQYIMDTHPPALYSRKWSWTVPLQRWMARGALMNITDQAHFKRLFESWGAMCMALENPPSDSPDYDQTIRPESMCFEIAVVNTFAVDEPLDIILEAARQLPDVRFSIMGDTTRGDKAMIACAPPNVVFTGYLLREAYWNCLARSRAVMVLTTYPNSLLGGAQDGVVMGKPLLLSRQPTLTEFFTKGTVFVENTTEGLIEGISQVRANEQRLLSEVADFEIEQAAAWEENFKELDAFVCAYLEPAR